MLCSTFFVLLRYCQYVLSTSHLCPNRILFLDAYTSFFFCIGRVLDMHSSLCYCASLNACLDDHLLCYVIIVVISTWLFWCMIKLLTCFTSCLLDRILLVTLYLSFYHLIYLEGLMCFGQVFQVTGIYVPSSSQLLWFMVGGVIW